MNMPKCFDGSKHNPDYLIPISSTNRLFYDEVVRWCKVCGAVVVDAEIDYRIYPGEYRPIEFPQLVKDLCGAE